MDISEVIAQSISRANRWHPDGINEWSVLEWAGAMCGESGEAANAAKKLKRIETSMLNFSEPDRQLTNVEDAKLMVAKECADTILYALILMHVCGGDADTIRNVFNQKSEEYNFPERI